MCSLEGDVLTLGLSLPPEVRLTSATLRVNDGADTTILALPDVAPLAGDGVRVVTGLPVGGPPPVRGEVLFRWQDPVDGATYSVAHPLIIGAPAR